MGLARLRDLESPCLRFAFPMDDMPLDIPDIKPPDLRMVSLDYPNSTLDMVGL